MKNHKRILSMFLALTLILGVMVIPANAAEAVAPIEWGTFSSGSLANGGKSYPVFSDESVAEDWLYRTKEGRAWVESVLDDPFLCILGIGPENRFDGIFYVCKADEVDEHGYLMPKPNDIPLDEARAKLDENKDNIIATPEPTSTPEPVETPKPTPTPTPMPTQVPTPKPVETDLTATAAETAPTFPDVDPDAWYAEAVNAMAANGVIKGGTDGLFRPDAPITYGELVTILARVSGVQDVIDRRAIEKPDEEYLVEGQGGYGRRVIDVSYNHTNHWAANAWACLNEFLNTPVPVSAENLDCKVDRAGALDLVYATKYWMVNGNSNRNHPGTRHHTYGGALDYAHNYGYSDIPDMQELIDTGRRYDFDGSDYFETNHLGAVVLDEKLNLWPDEYIQHFDENGDLVPGYDMDMVAEYTAPFYKPVSVIRLGNILGAYDTGITTGVDANRTGNFTANITRAEVAVMLYRAGLDDVYELCCQYPCPLAH